MVKGAPPGKIAIKSYGPPKLGVAPIFGFKKGPKWAKTIQIGDATESGGRGIFKGRPMGGSAARGIQWGPEPNFLSDFCTQCLILSIFSEFYD